MIRQPLSTSPDYLLSIRGLHRLHALAETGQDDSPEADAIRDSLERPWRSLSEVEKKRITGLSEDLYSLIEAAGETLPMNPQAQRELDEASSARQSGDWDQALELLRCWNRYLDPEVLAYLRGSIWRDAGDPETAALFLQHAARLNPNRIIHEPIDL